MRISSIQDRFSTTLLIFGKTSGRTPQDLIGFQDVRMDSDVRN
jgi:hypothetical protein